MGLEELRRRLGWYPHGVWLWLLAAGWKRIAQGEHLMGRAGQVGDEIGSMLMRDRTMSEAYSVVARMQNALGVVDALPADPRPFFARPFTVIFGERFADALKSRIDDARLRRLPFDIGGIDQWSDSTDLLEATALRLRLKAIYEPAD